MATEMVNYPDYTQDMNAVLKHLDCKWLNGTPPDYSLSDKLYYAERSKVHVKGSMSDMVNNLIKNWERELSYKTDPADWTTVVVPTFRMNTNGSDWLTISDLAKMGAYNAFIGNTELYSSLRVPDRHQSHQIFRTALDSGFGWECVETFSDAPSIVFKWRHWGTVTGEYKCPMRNGREITASPVGNKVEIFGMSKIVVNEKFQIEEMEHYFRPDQLLEQMIHGHEVLKI